MSGIYTCNGYVDIDLDDDDNDKDDYEDNISNGEDDDNVNDEVLEESDALPDDENSYGVPLLPSVIRINQDHGPGSMMSLLDAAAAALTTLEAVER